MSISIKVCVNARRTLDSVAVLIQEEAIEAELECGVVVMGDYAEAMDPSHALRISGSTASPCSERSG